MNPYYTSGTNNSLKSMLNIYDIRIKSVHTNDSYNGHIVVEFKLEYN